MECGYFIQKLVDLGTFQAVSCESMKGNQVACFRCSSVHLRVLGRPCISMHVNSSVQVNSDSSAFSVLPCCEKKSHL